MSNQRELAKSVINKALNTFALDIPKNWRFGKEREAVTIFTMDYLVSLAVSEGLIEKNSQVAMESRVPQLMELGKRQKSEVCKDLVIWSKPFENCWEDIGSAGNYPLAILEWKDDKNVIDENDLNWLSNYTSQTATKLGYAVSVNFHSRDFVLAYVTVQNGISSEVKKIGEGLLQCRRAY